MPNVAKPPKVITVRVPKEVRERVHHAAHDDRLSTNAWTVRAITRALGDQYATSSRELGKLDTLVKLRDYLTKLLREATARREKITCTATLKHLDRRLEEIESLTTEANAAIWCAEVDAPKQELILRGELATNKGGA